MSTIDQAEVVRLCRVLIGLVDDPHPGLATWNIACSETVDALAKALQARRQVFMEDDLERTLAHGRKVATESGNKFVRMVVQSLVDWCEKLRSEPADDHLTERERAVWAATFATLFAWCGEVERAKSTADEAVRELRKSGA